MTTWNQLYGAKRRATDRAILAECEKQISEALRGSQAAKNSQGPSAAILEACERQRIARAFGREVK